MPKLHFPLTPPDEHLLNEQQDDLLRNIPNGRSSPVEKELNLKEMMLAFEKYCEGDRTREYVTTARNITETEEIAIPENIPVSDLVPDTPTKRPASFVRHDDTPSKRRKMSSMVTDQIEAETEGPTEDNMEINEPILQRMDDNETVTDQRLDENVAGEIDVNEAFPPSPVAHEREADRQIEEKIPRVENIQVPEAQRLSQISEPEGPEIPAPKPRFKLTKVTANKMVQLSAQLTYQQKLEFQIRKHDQDILPSIHQPLSILERTEEELTRNENTLDLFDEIFYNTYFRLEVRSKVDERVQEPRDDAVLELENQEHDRRISRAPIEADISDVNNTDSRIANPQELSERSTLGHTIQIPNILVNDQPIEDVLEPISESNVEPAADPPFHSVVEPTLDQAQEATCNPTLQSPSQFRLQISRVYEADSYAAFFENLSFSEGEIVELDVIIPPESHNKLSLVRCLYCLLEFQKEKKILLSQDTCYGPILIRKWPIIE
ncbi:uncharacterized protein LOC122509945 isoform X2 [Leptopilina heterotoma]|nr:uncharacterized protein LOC122509945 isoform X2 [Leptopilina heterotoma]